MAASAETAPLRGGEGDWAALLEKIKGGDDTGELEPLAHQLYAAVSRRRMPPLAPPPPPPRRFVSLFALASTLLHGRHTHGMPRHAGCRHICLHPTQGLVEPADAAPVIAT